jgi:uncharacterized membrane protein HdeD (DUF308 family)
MAAFESGLGRHWWVLALRGVLAIVFGGIAVINPAAFWTAMVILFAACALVDGVASIVAATTGHVPAGRRWLFVLRGLLGIAAGAIAIVWPNITAVALYYVISGWAVATGVIEMAAGIDLSRRVRGAWLLIISGLLSVALGLLLGLHPLAGMIVVTWWVGAWAITYGVVLIILAFRLRSDSRHLLGAGYSTHGGRPSGAAGAG